MFNNTSAFIITIILVSSLQNVCTNQEKRYCERWDVRFEEGNSVTVPGQCLRATCVNAFNNEISTLGCRVYKLREGCYLTKEDFDKPYPDCCPQPVCPE